MKRTAVATLCVVGAWILAHSHAFAQPGHPRPFQRASERYLALLMQRQFAALDNAATRARAHDTKISDGQPELSTIYGGTAGCRTLGCRSMRTDELWQQRRQRLEEWRKANPASPTARLAHAMFPLQYAWFARGGGYAHSVRKDAWAIFAERVEEARKALEGLDAEAKSDPAWYAAMLDVGLAQGWSPNRIDRLYRQGIARHPYYIPIYFAASAYYAPRWYGSVGALRKFVEEATAITAEQLGETLYARLNWSLWTEKMFVDGQADWTRMKAGFERIVRDHPDPWNVNSYAKFACLATDMATVSRLASVIGNNAIAMVWYGDVSYYNDCVSRAELARNPVRFPALRER